MCMWAKISFPTHTFCLASHAVAAALALLSVENSRLTPLLPTPYLKLLLPLKADRANHWLREASCEIPVLGFRCLPAESTSAVERAFVVFFRRCGSRFLMPGWCRCRFRDFINLRIFLGRSICFLLFCTLFCLFPISLQHCIE